ncbi:Mobile element protein [Fimbriiglobus ruber]|uniref:Mobile element protein n=1 Tax=Fimbriiglobus ruber TaxID=1908690 RepID=A0A225DFL0_9BACT|nr:Mobile element protein [Fimbriiglobus ruber]
MVSIDAMGCQKEIAATIRANRGDDLLAVKDNQPHLKEDIESLSDRALEKEFATGTWDWYAKEETNRGRAEMRQCWVLTDLENREEIRDRALWADLKSVIVVVSERGEGGKSQTETRFDISSRVASARQFAGWARAHWGIENGRHYTRDETLREDRCRVRKGNAPRVLASLRNVAVYLLRGMGRSNAAAATRELSAHPRKALDLLHTPGSTSE